MKSEPTRIDLDKLRARIRRLGFEQAYLMLVGGHPKRTTLTSG